MDGRWKRCKLEWNRESIWKGLTLQSGICKFHFLQARNTHQNNILNDADKERFTSLTNKLLEAKTHAGYIKYVVDFIILLILALWNRMIWNIFFFGGMKNEVTFLSHFEQIMSLRQIFLSHGIHVGWILAWTTYDC